MGKKKSLKPKKPVGIRLSEEVYKRLERYVKNHPSHSLSSAAASLVEEALAPKESSDEQLTRLLTHFEERTTEQIATLNYNLRQATGMLLMPKPDPKTKPNEKFRIDSPQEAAKWVELKFKEIAD